MNSVLFLPLSDKTKSKDKTYDIYERTDPDTILKTIKIVDTRYHPGGVYEIYYTEPESLDVNTVKYMKYKDDTSTDNVLPDWLKGKDLLQVFHKQVMGGGKRRRKVLSHTTKKGARNRTNKRRKSNRRR